jgi:hypothetical protein
LIQLIVREVCNTKEHLRGTSFPVPKINSMNRAAETSLIIEEVIKYST